jgi:hypothetical protein
MSEEEPTMSTVNGKFRPPTDGSTLPTLSFSMITEHVLKSATPESAADYVEAWAPPGAKAWHAMRIDETPGNGRQSIEASLTVPGAATWELGEARISRIGGPAPRDVAFRNALYARVGAAAVAGGRIEAAMKRLILHMSGTLEPAFANTEHPWKTLEKKVRSAAMAVGEGAEDVIRLLDWAEENRIRDIRNDIIHAYWWDYSDVGITRGRVHLDGTSEIILMTPDQLDSDCEKLLRYAEALDSAMDGVWLNIYLPRLKTDGTAASE